MSRSSRPHTRRDILCLNDGGHDTATATERGVKRGHDRHYTKLILAKGKCEENKADPIIITLWEQRAARDDGKVAKVLEDIAKAAIKYAKDHLADQPVSAIVVKIGGIILDSLVSVFKRIFHDSPLGTKNIPVPCRQEFDDNGTVINDGTGTFDYVIHAKGNNPSYEYIIDIDVVIS